MSDKGPISDVHEGMTVIDSAGEKVGKVERIQMSDPSVNTPEGQDQPGGSPRMTEIANIVSLDTVPDEAKERLVRVGYVRIDARGIFTGDRYVAADEIAAVEGDTVRLTVPAEKLLG